MMESELHPLTVKLMEVAVEKMWHYKEPANILDKVVRKYLASPSKQALDVSVFKKLKIHCPNCDGSGAKQISEDECEQCQWCHEFDMELEAICQHFSGTRGLMTVDFIENNIPNIEGVFLSIQTKRKIAQAVWDAQEKAGT